MLIDVLEGKRFNSIKTRDGAAEGSFKTSQRRMRSPAVSIALLLILAAVVNSLEDQVEEGLGDKHHAGKQNEPSKDLCDSCKSLVTTLKKMGKEASKDKIAKLVEKVCSDGKDKSLEAACKKITGDVKDKLSEAVAKGDDATTVCKKVKLCKKKPLPRL